MKAYDALFEIYDPWMAHFDYDRWADYLWDLMTQEGAAPGAQVLELACGTGLITERLARLGCRMTATDVSDAMLTRAMERTAGKGLAIQWVRMDMRDARVHHPENFVLCTCDGINYLTDPQSVAQTFIRAWEALNPGGWFFFDISSQDKLLAMDGEFYSQESDQAACLWHNRLEAATSVLTMELVLFIKRPDGLYERFEEQHRQRAHSQQELTQQLIAAGFDQVRCYKAFTQLPPQNGDQRIQFAAQKPPASKKSERVNGHE